MINSNENSQLDQLKATLDEKHRELVNRKRIIFHQDNTRCHVSLMTRQKPLELGWEVLIHPPYSPDIAPLNFHLFWSLQNSLNGKNFSSFPGRQQNAPGTVLCSKQQSLGKMVLSNCLKDGKRQWKKTVNTLFNKGMSFYF